MEHGPTSGSRAMHLIAWLAVAITMALAIAAAPQQASAYASCQHGGIDDCETCHVNAPYHARASLAASAGNTAVRTPWSGFRVE